MARKRAKRGAEILYSDLVRCELRDGFVCMEMGSGEHRERGAVPIRLAMELHDRLGALLAEIGEVTCLVCRRQRRQRAKSK